MTVANVSYPELVSRERKMPCSGSILSDADKNICSSETRKNFHSTNINTVLSVCIQCKQLHFVKIMLCGNIIYIKR